MLKIFAIFLILFASTKAQTSCPSLGDLQTFLDPSCAQGGAGWLVFNF